MSKPSPGRNAAAADSGHGRARTTKRAAKATRAERGGTPKPSGKSPPRRALGPRPMRSYASFDLYLADQPPPQQRLIRALRRLVARCAPSLQEGVKWGNGCWLDGKAPIAYVYAADDHVQFGFVNGAALDDPAELLQGGARYVRHVPVRKPGDIDQNAFAALLRQAIALGHPAFGK